MSQNHAEKEPSDGRTYRQPPVNQEKFDGLMLVEGTQQVREGATIYNRYNPCEWIETDTLLNLEECC